MIVVVGVNIAYVYIVLYESATARTLAQVTLSVFKTVWSGSTSPYLLHSLRDYYKVGSVQQTESFFSLELLIALLNSIVIPCLVVLAIDPNCFSDLLLPQHGATSTYYAQGCDPYF